MIGLNISRPWVVAGLVAATAVALSGCGSGGNGETTSETTGGATVSKLSGEVKIDGSGTVFPIQAALSELFQGENPDVKVSVGKSGTGAGMEKFIAGETDLSDASRPIKQSEVDKLTAASIDFIELPVAFDGLSIVVNNENTWLKQVTIEQLHKIWDKDSKLATWDQVDPSFPKEKIVLYGPTSAHGTYEYFNEAVNGDGKNTRQDYEQCAEYDPLIAGVQGSKFSLGYVGYAYYAQNKDKIRVVPVVNKDGKAIDPSETTIKDGSYNPLSRPLMVYVKVSSSGRPEVKAYVDFLLGAGNKQAVEAAGYVVLPDEILATVKQRFANKKTGSVLTTMKPGSSLSDVLAAEK